EALGWADTCPARDLATQPGGALHQRDLVSVLREPSGDGEPAEPSSDHDDACHSQGSLVRAHVPPDWPVPLVTARPAVSVWVDTPEASCPDPGCVPRLGPRPGT